MGRIIGTMLFLTQSCGPERNLVKTNQDNSLSAFLTNPQRHCYVLSHTVTLICAFVTVLSCFVIFHLSVSVTCCVWSWSVLSSRRSGLYLTETEAMCNISIYLSSSLETATHMDQELVCISLRIAVARLL